MARALEHVEAIALEDLHAFRELDGLDGITSALVVLALRVAAMPRTVGARRPSTAVAFARAREVLERAAALVSAMESTARIEAERKLPR